MKKKKKELSSEKLNNLPTVAQLAMLEFELKYVWLESPGS